MDFFGGLRATPSGAASTTTPPEIDSLVLEPSEVVGGPATISATVSLSWPAVDHEVVINLAADHHAVTVPPQVTIAPSGVRTFAALSVTSVSAPVIATVTASLESGAARTAQLRILPVTTVRDALADRSRELQIATGHLPTATAQSVWAPIVATMPFLPLAAAVWTVLIYVAPSRLLTGDGTVVALSNLLVAPLPALKAHLLLAGALAAMLTGLLATGVSFFVLSATSAQRANVRMFGELCGRLRVLQVRITGRLADPNLTPEQRQACAEAAALHAMACAELAQPGLRWVLGSGYITIWRLVHGAEEIMLTVTSNDELAGIAVVDELRLHKSDVANRELLTDLVRKGLYAVDPRLTWYLQDGTLPGLPPAAPPDPGSGPHVLRHVRAAMHQYRDGQWSALVRTRNHLLATFGMAGTVTYLTIVLAISGRRVDTPDDLGSDPIVGGAALFLVGALVGLIPRLRGQTQAELAIEDYGLARARLNLIPLLSGLAALAGVLVVQLIPGFQSLLLSVVPGTTVASGPSLTTMLTLNTNSLAVLLAAIFGLTPNLLVTLLRRGADRLQQSLLSTTASQNAVGREKPTETPSTRLP